MTRRSGSPLDGVPAKRRGEDPSEVEELEQRLEKLEGKFQKECDEQNKWLKKNQEASHHIIYDRNLKHLEECYDYKLRSLKIRKNILRAKLKLAVDISDEEQQERLRNIAAEEETDKLQLESEKEAEKLKLASEKEEKEMELKYKQKLENIAPEDETEKLKLKSRFECEKKLAGLGPEFEQKRAKLEPEYAQKRAVLEREYEQKRADRERKCKQTQAKLGREHVQRLADEQRDYEQKLQSIDAKRAMDQNSDEEMDKVKLESEQEEEPDTKCEQKRAKLQRKHERIRARLERGYEQKLQRVAAKHEIKKLKLKSAREDDKLELKYGKKIKELELPYDQQRAELACKLEFKEIFREFYKDEKQTLKEREAEGVQRLLNAKEVERLANSQRGEKERERKRNEIEQVRVRRFLDSLREEEGKPKVLQGNIMRVPDGVCLGGKMSLNHLHGQLLIRTCYVNLCELLFEKCEIDKRESDSESEKEGYARRRRFSILGNPGIGKSLFSYYLMYRLIQKQQTIVWQPYKSNCRVLITPTDPIEFGDVSTGFRTELDSPSTWYIVDADHPALVSANIVLITSPRKDIIKPFEKEYSLPLYMPVWSKKEIRCARRCGLANSAPDGAEVSRDNIREHFLFYGGIPRNVFEILDQKKLKAEVKDAIDDAAPLLGTWIRKFRNMADPDPTSHKVLQINPHTEEGPERYQQFTLSYASTQIEDRVKEGFLNLSKKQKLEFLDCAIKLKSFATMTGPLFEAYVHDEFVNGGKFTVRKLTKKPGSTKPEEIDLTQSRRKRFINLKDMTMKDDAYWIPVSETFESIDSLMSPDMLFQITIAEDHPVKKQGIVNAATRLRTLRTRGEDSLIRLYFVVPFYLFNKYKLQNYLDQNNHVEKGEDNHVPNVEQYVLGMDYTDAK